MAGRARVILNHRVLEDILKDEVVPHLEDIAMDIESRTGMPTGEYEMETWVGINRARVSLKTTDWPAHAREARDHNLVMALGGGAPSDGVERFAYTNARGVTSMRTAAEIANYTRNR